jgi:hypothetical protein
MQRLGGNATLSMREAASYAKKLLETCSSPSVSVALVETGRAVAQAFGAIDRKSGRAPTPERCSASIDEQDPRDDGRDDSRRPRLVSLDLPFADYMSGFSMQSPEAADITVRCC